MFQYSPILGRSSIWDLKFTFSLYRPTNFPKFLPWFFYPFFYKFNPRFGIFFGCRNVTHVYRFFGVKATHLGGTSPYYSLHMWSYSPSPPPHPLKGHSYNSAILSIYGMHRYENFATKLWESVGKGHILERVISAGTLEWRGAGAPSARVPRVCPPWAHRSYATVLSWIAWISIMRHKLFYPPF